jgi:hypothetical protein
VSEDDLLNAIKQLKVLGGGFGVVTIGAKKLVSSVPRELNRDHNAVFELAQVRSRLPLRGAAMQSLRIVTVGVSGGRSLTRPFRDARRFP